MKKTSATTVTKLLLGGALIAVISMWLYHPTTRNQFVWDSHTYLVTNSFWISKLNLNHIIWMLFSLEVLNWHPLTWLSWAIDYQVYGGLDSWGFHFSNNLLHAANGGLVFLLTLVFFGLNQAQTTAYPLRKDRNALIAGFLAALLFSIHPQHVESVAWVAERKDLLFLFFLLLSTLTYVRYVSCNENAINRWFNSTLGLFVLALLSKPMAITFPMVLLLIDVYPLRRVKWIPAVNHSQKQQPIAVLLREKVPFFILSVLLVLITLLAQQQALGNTSVTFYMRIFNAFNSIIFYLTKLFAPTNFAALYPISVIEGDSLGWRDFIAFAGVAGLTLGALVAWKKGHHAWLVAWLFYLITLAPVLGLVQMGQQGAADRYTYLPTIAVFMLFGAGVLNLLDKINFTKRLILILSMLPLVFLLAHKSRQQIQTWETDETLWQNTVMLYPDNSFAQLNLGLTYYNYRDYEKALHYFEKAENLAPNDPVTLSWLGLTHLRLDRYTDAIGSHVKLAAASESSRKWRADQFCVQYNIGWLYAQLGMHSESSELFSRVDPKSPLGHNAGVWLNWLNNVKRTGGQIRAKEGLPGVCDRLLVLKSTRDDDLAQ